MVGFATTAKTHVFANDDLSQVLATDEHLGDTKFSKTKIAITLGPTSRSVDTLCEMLEAGATCARVDLTWNTVDFHRTSLRNLQEAMRHTKRLCAVMLDTLGREIMVVRSPTGRMEANGVAEFEVLEVGEGERVVVTSNAAAPCTAACLPVSYPGFAGMPQPGDSIFVGRYLTTGADAGSLFLRVESVNGSDVVCVAQNSASLGGVLTVFHQERSAEGLSNAQNELPILADSDKAAIIALAREFEIDFLSLSYTRGAEDVEAARAWLVAARLPHTKVLAKCETRQSLFALRGIVEASDGVIVSRGNLGLDVAPERMAMTQKAMAAACLLLNRPCLITRVVDTMISTPRPTRAEATDIANAVLDGVDGILLGAETYRGAYAIAAVDTVVAIAREAEAVFDHRTHFERLFADAKVLAGGDARGGDELRRSISHASGLNSSSGATGAPFGAPPAPSPVGFAGGGFGMPLGVAHPPLPRVSSVDSTAAGASSLGTTAAQRLSKVEAMASSAVRAGDKVGAALMIVVSQTGRAASLVAKYRPPMPIMALVVPYLKREGLRWSLEGRATARQLLLTSGLVPVLAAPAPSAGESLLEEAVALASAHGIIGPHDHVVVLSRGAMDEYMIKIVTVNAAGDGIKLVRPRSIANLLKARGQIPDEEEEEEEEAGLLSMVDRRASVVLGAGGRDALVMQSIAEDEDDEEGPPPMTTLERRRSASLSPRSPNALAAAAARLAALAPPLAPIAESGDAGDAIAAHPSPFGDSPTAAHPSPFGDSPTAADLLTRTSGGRGSGGLPPSPFGSPPTGGEFPSRGSGGRSSGSLPPSPFGSQTVGSPKK